jgi:hypothetical protein
VRERFEVAVAVAVDGLGLEDPVQLVVHQMALLVIVTSGIRVSAPVDRPSPSRSTGVGAPTATAAVAGATAPARARPCGRAAQFAEAPSHQVRAERSPAHDEEVARGGPNR